MEILYAILVVGIIGLLMGLILGIASKYLQVEMDPRYEKIVDLLPGYNCGACGNPGCSGMAEAILAEKINLSACKPAKKPQLQEIEKYLKSTPGADGSFAKTKM